MFNEHLYTLGLARCFAVDLGLRGSEDRKTTTTINCGAFAVVIYFWIAPRLFRTPQSSRQTSIFAQ